MMAFLSLISLLLATYSASVLSAPCSPSCSGQNSQPQHQKIFPQVSPVRLSSVPRTASQHSRRAYPLATAQEYTFSVEVTIGGQSVYLEVDTGSSNIWTIEQGFLCESGWTCNFGNAIQMDSQFEQIPGETFSTSYVDGSGASGIMVNTSVEVAGVAIPEQTVGLATWLGSDGDGIMSGILGLAYPVLTTATDDSTTVHYSSVPNTIFQNGLSDPVFAIAISRDASKSGFGGYMTIGGVPDLSDPAVNAVLPYGSASIEINPVFNFPGQLTDYAIYVDALGWSSSSGTDDEEDSTSFLYIVDSGTTSSHVPNSDAAAINALFDPPATQDDKGNYMVLCNAKAPTIYITVGGVQLSINPADLILPGTGTCYSGIQGIIASFPVGIIGDSMLRSLLAVFDWGEEKVHLASRPFYES